MKNTCRLLKNIAVLFCIIFTVAIVASCIINVLIGNTNDTYIHILDRAVLTLIGSIIIVIAIDIDFKSSILNCLIPYLIFIALAFIYVFISGFFVELHSNAYRDIFINDTIAYIIVYVGVMCYNICYTNE
ncbi:DUF6608 family protein [Peptostreptococcus sp. D1]|uniref:DUF6608 family protein n=1 Tax=Peptostreptococcus sp. D1 TaxID=72304 RepID=UPI0008F07A55|nr:DUF6608 family protein [Peptostreptococcus sp. D1]SFE94356.1 hypothetical protein SAMN02910278_02133 [Peptostreptococcus sp. D1]